MGPIRLNLLRVDARELEAARWFDRAEIAQAAEAPGATPLLPFPA